MVGICKDLSSKDTWKIEKVAFQMRTKDFRKKSNALGKFTKPQKYLFADVDESLKGYQA